MNLPLLIPEPRTDPLRGIHATTGKTAQAILAGSPFVPSSDGTEWLGHGVYFWIDESMAWWWQNVES